MSEIKIYLKIPEQIKCRENYKRQYSNSSFDKVQFYWVKCTEGKIYEVYAFDADYYWLLDDNGTIQRVDTAYFEVVKTFIPAQPIVADNARIKGMAERL